MTGWTIIFAAVSTTSGVWGGIVRTPTAIFVSVLFGALFVLALCLKAVRGVAD
jgi:hypothetical protein